MRPDARLLKFSGAKLRDFSQPVAENHSVHVMVESIPGNQDIANVQRSIQESLPLLY